MEQVGAGQNLWKAEQHYTLREVAKRSVRKFNTTALDYHLSLNPSTTDAPLADQLADIFNSLVDNMTTGIDNNDLVRFVLQSNSLDYPISLPFMPRHELNSDRIMGEVQRVLQSHESVDLENAMHVHLVHVAMPQGGAAVRKRKHYGFNVSFKFAIKISCVLLAPWLQTWLVKNVILTGKLFAKDAQNKPFWPKSCIKRAASQRVLAVFQKLPSFNKLSQVSNCDSFCGTF